MNENEISVVKFCREILDFLDGKSEKPEWFYQDVGLCLNFINYSNNPNHDILRCVVGWETNIPFGNYYENGDYINNRLYKNPARLAFLRAWAGKEI